MYGSAIGPQPAAVGSGLESLSSASLMLNVFGALTQTVGSYYSALSAKNEAKSRALSFQYEATAASQAASAAERDAQGILQAGAQQRGMYGLEANMQAASRKASMAASGTRTGVGSSAEAAASDEIIRQIDLATMNTNTVRAAEESRMRGANYANQARMAGVSAQNMRRTASTINPALAAGGTLLSQAGQVAGQWYQHSRRYG